MTSPIAPLSVSGRFANTTGSRRRPWPYDMYLGYRALGTEVRVLLEPDQDGVLVSEDAKTLDETAPIDYTYSSANPYRERTQEYQALYGGFGQAVQPETQPRRYFWAEKADLSIDGLWMKGPAFEEHVEPLKTAQPTAPGEIRQFITALYNNVLTLFAICQYGVWLYRQADGVWVESLTAASSPTLTAGVYPQQAVRFKHRGTTPIDALYLATSTGEFWRLNGAGTTWVRAVYAGAPGPGAGEGPIIPTGETGASGAVRYIERVADELWAGSVGSVMKCEDDPFVRANWSGAIGAGGTFTPVGDLSNPITWLKQVDDTLYIFKEDGIYTVDSQGLDHELFPTLRGRNHPFNGKNAAVFLDRIWFTYGDQTFTLTGGGQLKADGLEQMLENTSDVKGRWVAGAGHNTWFMYEAYYNEETTTSFLVKHGSWIEEGSDQATPGVAQFAEAHHGALYDWDNRITAMEVVPDVVAGASIYGNDKLYIGFADGTCTWAYLPRHSPNPMDDPACEYTNGDTYVYLPQHHSNFRADNKLWHAMTVFGPYLTTTEWAEIEYKTDVTNPTAAWEKVWPDDPKYTLPGQRKNLIEDEVTNPIFGRQILVRVKLAKYLPDGSYPDPPTGEDAHPTSPLYVSPVIEGIAIHESIRPAFSREFTFSIKLGSFLPKRDGTVDRRRASDIQERVLKLCASVGPIYVLLPTGQVEPMTITRYKDSYQSRQKVRDHTWTMQISAVQLRTITEGAPQSAAPIVVGLTYDTLEQYTLGELQDII